MDWEDYKKSKKKRAIPKWVLGVILLAITLFGLFYNAYMVLSRLG